MTPRTSQGSAAMPRETGGGNAAALGAANLLCLAAAPTFAIMALLTSVFDGGSTGMLCAAAHGVSALSGMVPMYLLMGAFHLAAWLRLIARRIVTDDGLTMDQ
jgi:hypothetical protein